MLGVDIKVAGLEQTLKQLAKIDPEIKKQFRKDAKDILKPLIDDARSTYPSQVPNRPPMRGDSRNWSFRGRQIFPYDRAAARRGVRFTISTKIPATTILRVRQVNPAASVLETAGRGSTNPLGNAVKQNFGSRDRFMWKAAKRKLPSVEAEMRQSIRRMIGNVNRGR